MAKQHALGATSSRLEPLWLVPVLLAATGIRVFGLGATDLWGDEAFSVVASLGSPSHLLSMLGTGEPHPPLYPFLLAVWLRLAGSSEFAARLPSAFAGIASVAVAAAIARYAAPGISSRAVRTAALVAAALVAANPFQVWYSQEARMYAQVSFFAGLATLALLRMRQGRRWSVPLYAIAVLGAAGTHYYGLFVPPAHGLALLLASQRDRAEIVSWLKACVIAGLAFLPWAYFAQRIAAGYLSSPPKPADLLPVIGSTWARVIAGWSLDWESAIRVAAVLSVIAVVGTLLPARTDSDRFTRATLVLWLSTPVAIAYGLSLLHPLFNERYLIVSSLPFILLCARGIGWLLATDGIGQRAVALPGALAAAGGIAVLAVTLGAAYVALRGVWAGEYVKSQYSIHTRTIDLIGRGGEGVILNGMAQEPLYRYYAHAPLPFYTLPRRDPIDVAATTDELTRIASQHSGAWTIWYTNTLYDPQDVIGKWLALHGYLSTDRFAGNARVQYYAFSPDSALASASQQLRFGDTLALGSYQWTGADPRAGDTVAVGLVWTAGTGAPADYVVSLRLVDEKGFIWGQSDQAIGNGYLSADAWSSGQSVEDRHGVRIPTGTPPGEYALRLVVSRRGSATPLAVAGDPAVVGPSSARLATVHMAAGSQVFWTGDVPGFHTARRPFGPGTNLLGYAGSTGVRAGESGYLTLVWQATSDRPPIGGIALRLATADGRVVQSVEWSIGSVANPASVWRLGDVIRAQYRLPVRLDVPPGDYLVSVSPAPKSGQDDAIALGTLHVEQPAVGPPAAAAARAVDAAFGDGIRLIGVNGALSQVKAGQTLKLGLRWASVATTQIDYTVFAHVLDASGKVVAQRDQQPSDGHRPTSAWFVGDEIADEHSIELPASLALGTYRVEIGVYDPTTGARLQVLAAGQPASDQLVIGELQIIP